MHFTHGEVKKADCFRGSTREEFVMGAAEIIADVNTIHPFREGNGRTQFQYLKQLGAQAGHPIDLSRFQKDEWLAASRLSIRRETGPMADQIHKAIITDRDRSRLEEARGRYQTLREQLSDQDKNRGRDR